MKTRLMLLLFALLLAGAAQACDVGNFFNAYAYEVDSYNATLSQGYSTLDVGYGGVCFSNSLTAEVTVSYYTSCFASTYSMSAGEVHRAYRPPQNYLYSEGSENNPTFGYQQGNYIAEADCDCYLNGIFIFNRVYGC